MEVRSVAASARRKAYVNIILPLFIISVIAYIDRVNISYAALTMNKDLGFSAQVFGMGAGVFFVGYVLLEIPGAIIAEKFSPKKWLARIMISWGLVSSLMVFMTTEWEFYIIRFLLGAAEASLYPVMYASCVPRWFAPNERAYALGVLLTSMQISAIIGAPLASTLLGVSLWGLKGWQVLFVLEAIPAVAFGFVVIWWMADKPEEARWLTREEKKFLSERYAEEVAVKTAVKKYRVLDALRDREVLKLGLIYFLWITGFWGFNYWMPQVLKAASGWSNMAIGWLTIIPMTAALLAMVFLGYSSSKTGEKRWHGAIGLFIGSVGMGWGVFTQNAWLSFFCLTLAAIGNFAPFGVWWSYPTTFLSGTAAAGAIGLINSCGNIGGFLGPYITGFIKESTGSFNGAWLYLAVSLLLAGLMVLTLKKELPTDTLDKTNN